LILLAKNYQNRPVLQEVIQKNKSGTVFETLCVLPLI